RFGGDQGLEINQIQQRRFKNLALQNRPLHTHQRFLRKNHRAFGNRVHVAREFHFAEVIEKWLFKQRLAVTALQMREINKIRFFKVKSAQVINRMLESARDRKAAGERLFAKEKME